MNYDEIHEICGAMPGGERSQPFGPEHDVWKIGGKIYAAMGREPFISLKTDSIETAQMLIDAGVGIKAPYFHRSWIALPLDADPDELRHRIGQSYAIIRASLPKKLQASLSPA